MPYNPLPGLRWAVFEFTRTEAGEYTMIHVDEVAAMHRAAIGRWHRDGLDNPFSGFLALACHQCSLNYLLWHEEDAARNPAAREGEIALIKRTIDQLNQQRNNFIEQMDVWIAEELATQQIRAGAEAALNTETPGSAIDRLAILALRIYHLEEQLQRSDAAAQHLQLVQARLSICHLQQADLLRAASQLLSDIYRGQKRHQIYRQFKMYNDPDLNPYLYRTIAWRHTPQTEMESPGTQAAQGGWPAASADPSGKPCHP